MYTPRANQETRLPVLYQLIRAEPLATLVTLTSKGLLASHIPLVLDVESAPLGVLRGHLARANSQWQDMDSSVEALAIFAGPHHYISASGIRAGWRTARTSRPGTTSSCMPMGRSKSSRTKIGSWPISTS